MRISDWSSDVCSSDLCLAALRPLHPHRIPLPPSPAGVLGRPCSGRWHGHRRTGDLKGVRTMTHQTRESWLNAVAQGVAPLFAALDAPLPARIRVAIGFTSSGRKGKAIGECWDNRLSADGHFEIRSEEHTSELQSLMRISYAVFCLKKNNIHTQELVYPMSNINMNKTHLTIWNNVN